MKKNNIIKTTLCLSVFFSLSICLLSCSSAEPKPTAIVTGRIYDASYPAGKNIPLINARVKSGRYTAYSDNEGRFSITVTGQDDPVLYITADNYHPYKTRSSEAENGEFYLIPENLYKDFRLLTWGRTPINPQNWHRKWVRQPEFVIIRNKAEKEQVDFIIETLKSDKFTLLTGGLYSCDVPVKVFDKQPVWTQEEKENKIIFYFADGILENGIACSFDLDKDGIIDYGEVGYDTSQTMIDTIVWHELSHVATAGGHINYRQSVNNEKYYTNTITDQDIKVFNCIYNSPPKRSN